MYARPFLSVHTTATAQITDTVTNRQGLAKILAQLNVVERMHCAMPQIIRPFVNVFQATLETRIYTAIKQPSSERTSHNRTCKSCVKLTESK